MTPKEHTRITQKLNKLLNDFTDLVVLIGHIHPDSKVASIKAPKAKIKAKTKTRTKARAAVKKGAAKGSAKLKKNSRKPKERKNVTLDNVFLVEHD